MQENCDASETMIWCFNTLLSFPLKNTSVHTVEDKKKHEMNWAFTVQSRASYQEKCGDSDRMTWCFNAFFFFVHYKTYLYKLLKKEHEIKWVFTVQSCVSIDVNAHGANYETKYVTLCDQSSKMRRGQREKPAYSTCKENPLPMKKKDMMLRCMMESILIHTNCGEKTWLQFSLYCPESWPKSKSKWFP